MDAARMAHRYRFGTFEFDASLLELWRGGRKVRLRPQPLKLLALLVARPGELVPREDIHAVLWGDDTFVDFEQGVNHCIKQLRAALRDSVESPRFIQTVPRHGYRFIAPVLRGAAPEPEIPATSGPPSGADDLGESAPPVTSAARRHRLVAYAASAILAIAALLALAVRGGDDRRPAGEPTSGPPVLAVLPFASTGSDSALGTGLATSISSRLAVQRFAS